ncbi:hypothetical protein QLQ12_06120 [Actinoplanes sp. NEAU-A12]|uniref:PPE family domain-containing protein n=1 Tax=Actinoplanes sandaracinus TaxID=3045177 RepID=A0ABT6WES1_9ACTN|nr:hypothetical protein [Actinoplanes sandaracinus]MDI6098178.1 hypothetical protein [Actinoplanes sandaracinus]
MVQDPNAFLTPPTEPDESWTNGFIDPAFLFNYVSPTSWINELINSVTGKDVLGTITESIAGDWSKIWAFGDAMTNVGRWSEQVAVNVQQEILKLDSSWDGNANDAAYNYFTNLAVEISDLRFALTEIGESYRTAAKGAWGLATQMGNMLQALCDMAIAFCLVVAGSALTTSVGVGFAGYGVAGLMAAEMMAIASKLFLIASTASMAVFGTFGAAMDAAYQGGDLSSVKLPTSPYPVLGT